MEKMEELKEMRKKIHRSLTGPARPIDAVLDAVDVLVREMQSGVYSDLLGDYDLSNSPERLSITAKQMGRRTLLKRLEEELTPLKDTPELTRRRVPLGVLLHIAAGNTDVLTVFTVLEGLITGNINIVKLPSHDGGFTEKMVDILLHLEPRLSEYIYLVNAPSSDVDTLSYLAEMSNAVVVWGGDDAVRSIRRITEPDTKIFEWGHKLSFAYLSGDFMHWSVENDLKGLARHIFRTQQLLTSSCQVIYLDTDDPAKQQQFCERFLPILENEFVTEEANDNVISEGTLKRFTARTKERESLPGEKDYKADHCCLTACEDQALDGSGRFGHMLVKRLPQEQIVSVLSPYNGYLHTAGVLEAGTKIQELLIHAGVTRITRLADMSKYFDGEAHDGVFPLELYTKIVDIQK